MKSKKFFVKLLMCLLLILPIYSVSASDIKIMLDGNELLFDVPPQLINERTMVPVRAIFEALGASVEWDPDFQLVTSIKDNNTVHMQIGNNNMLVNGTTLPLDAPSVIVDGRTLVPVRAVAEAFNADVKWDGETKTVFIDTFEEYLCYPNTAIPDYCDIYNILPTQTYLTDAKDAYWYHYPINEELLSDYISYLVTEKNFTLVKFEKVTTGIGYELSKGDNVMLLFIYENEFVLAPTTHSRYAAFYGAQQSSNNNAEQTNVNSALTVNNVQFPLTLWSDEDEPVFLGKITTNKYDSESISNSYGDYGSRYSSTSIFNNYSKYGSDYSRYSAFNEHASHPPLIVDASGNIVGKLSENEYKTGSITYEELLGIIEMYNQ